MMYMYRKFMKVLEEWHEDKDRKALLVNGARQVGKTTLIREFGRKYYGNNFVEINFKKHPETQKFFCMDRSAETFLKEITSYTGRSLPEHKTLIFFDDVQECPEVRTAIKFLADDGRYDYIEAGTCAGVMYDKVASYAVGYEHERTMFPMDFEEFLLALGEPRNVIDKLKECYENQTPVNDFIHHVMMENFAQYMCIGGMPSVVKTFLDTGGDMAAVKRKQRSILRRMREDVARYADANDAESILQAMDAIPANLNSAGKDSRHYYSGAPYEWLKDACIAFPSFSDVKKRGYCGMYTEMYMFRMYMEDTGLLVAMDKDRLLQFNVLNGDFGAREGGVLENALAQHIAGNFWDGIHDLQHYTVKDIGDVSFIVCQPDGEIPIMVIPGDDYRNHKALDRLMHMKEYSFKQAIVFCKGNISRDKSDERIIYMPFYMIMFLKEKSIMEFIRLEDPAAALKKYFEKHNPLNSPPEGQDAVPEP
ncbi:MAG: ATP-binding protein [Clostridia bacterium]|nr:ATP-binding protein [Clostridia bacterium]